MEVIKEMIGTDFINDKVIFDTIEKTKNISTDRIRAIIKKSLELKGLDFEETASLLSCSESKILSELYDAARQVKNRIYGDRLVLFAPLYISNLCRNECTYCAFRASNKDVKRRALNQDEIREEVVRLVDQGHKRILLVAGESLPEEGLDYVLNSIDTVYGVTSGKGNIRRLNINIAPLEVDEFRKLKEKSIGTYQLFQETYHRETYNRVHKGGKKRNYDWRLTAIDRAFQAGIDDVGIGILFGLYDYRYEILALMQHIEHLEKTYGIGPHTISVPRLEPAIGSDIASHPPHPVSDADFRKIVAVLRLAVPYTGIIMSTRETSKMRKETFALGVSQISAGSRTNPGGYSSDKESGMSEQFSLGDHRPLDEVIRDVAELGYVPSFCTACYRLGRTGADFMDLAKPGEIKYHCGANALSTFMEYLLDYASPETLRAGEALIEKKIGDSDDPKWTATARKLVDNVKAGRRDCYI
jgi:2-iminoacetate synthase